MFSFNRFTHNGVSIAMRASVLPQKLGSNSTSRNVFAKVSSSANNNASSSNYNEPVKIFKLQLKTGGSLLTPAVPNRKFSDSSLESRNKGEDVPMSILDNPGKAKTEDEQRWFHRSMTEKLENPALTYLKNHPEYQTLFFQHQVYSRLMTEDGRLTTEGEETVNPAVKAFIDLCNSKPDEYMTDPKYQQVFDNLASETPKLTDIELLLVYYNICRFPKRPKAKDNDYRKIWQPLDDLCVQRFFDRSWNLEFMFNMADLIFSADLQKESRFNWLLLKMLYRRVDSLSKEEFIRMMFCFGGVKSLPDSLSLYNIEYNLPKFIDELSPEEVSVVSVGFLRTKTYVSNRDMLKKMLSIVANDAPRIPNPCISAVAKAVNVSTKPDIAEDVYNFLDAFVSEIPRMDCHACASVVLLATRSKVEHPQFLLEVVKQLEGNINVIRKKDLEYFTVALTTFNVNCDKLYQEIVDEFRKHLSELSEKSFCIAHGRTFVTILQYLTLRNIYPVDLISVALSPEFMDRTYGRSMYSFTLDVLLLDLCTHIEVEGYSGPRLPEKYQGFLTKKNMLWIAEEEKVNMSNYQLIARYMVEVCDDLLGGPEFCHLCNLVPPFRSIGAVYCIDETSQKPVPVPETYTSIDEFNVKHIPESESGAKIKYHAFVLFPGTHFALNTFNPLGVALMHSRQMEKMGYKVHPIYLGHTVSSPEEMKQFISETLGQQTATKRDSSVS